MRRDTRYAAFLALAAVFFCFFTLSNTGARRSPPSDAAAPHAAPFDPHDIRGLIPGFPININTATAEELTALPGVGDATAARIIEKRRELGGFASVEQLTEVRWVGKVKLDRIRSLVTVD